MHVTLRVLSGVPRLRNRLLLKELRRTLRKVVPGREWFRVVHYSIQQDHLHLLVEAEGRRVLTRGMTSVGSRVARAVNRVFRRKGAVLDGRFHHTVLRAPRQVRNALAYVLLNHRKHTSRATGRPPPVAVDPFSSQEAFEGWSRPPPGAAGPSRSMEVAPARSWLLRVGWARHGRPIDPAEVPGAA